MNVHAELGLGFLDAGPTPDLNSHGWMYELALYSGEATIGSSKACID